MALSLKESSSCSYIGSSEMCTGSSERIDGKNLYRTDKKCVRCQVKFGLSMTIYKKKYWCKFCRRGVCSDCSPQRVPNPETMKIDRICNECFQKVMAEHFKKEVDEEIGNYKKQKEELNFLLGQEIRNRAKISTKKKILEGILNELEKESERKDRDLRIKISKLRAKKDNIVGKMNGIVKKFHETQREREKKEKAIKDLELQSEEIKKQFKGPSELWAQMRELREKKIKLMKKCELTFNTGSVKENENYEDLVVVYKEAFEENQQLLEELSQLTAELEMKEQKIKNLQKKIAEISSISTCENQDDHEFKELKDKISQQQEVIEELKDQLNKKERIRDDLENRHCSVCTVF